MPKGATPGKGRPREAREYDQTYLDPGDTTQVHRDYAAHYFRWGHAHRFCKGKRVLDLGCGPAHMLGRVLVKHGNMGIRPELYVGTDLSPLPPKETKHIKLRGGVDATSPAGMLGLLQEFGQFDVVTSFEVIEHMPVEAGARYLHAANVFLRPGGTLLISTPRNEGHKPARNHIHEYGTDELRDAIVRAGFHVAKRYGTFGDVVKLRKASEGTPYEAAMRDLAAYYSDDVIACFLAPLFPDACKNNIWVCHPVPAPPSGPRGLDLVGNTVWGPESPLLQGDGDSGDGWDPGTQSADGDPEGAGDPEELEPDAAAYTLEDEELELIDADQEPSALPPVVAINTYAGSLLLGAKAAAADVHLSLEDSGYGQEWAKANFPDTVHVASRGLWPEASLDHAVVVAHPPCAAFSIQAKGTILKSGTGFGTQSEHFKCTREVLNYALRLRALAVGVESVQGALDGARVEHDSLAEQYGYHVFRLLQNACTFGVPQWRPRFWALFVRKDVSSRFGVWHTPRCVTLGDVLDSEGPGPADPKLDHWLKVQRQVLVEKGAWVDDLFETPGMLARNLQLKVGGTLDSVSREYCLDGRIKLDNPPKMTRFVVCGLRVLDPASLAPVVMGDSFWSYRGSAVTPAEFRAVMGFPRDYELGPKYRTYLSKGVVPAVAAWVVDLLRRNVAGQVPPGAKWASPGETVDLQVTRKTWARLAAGEEVRDPFGWGDVVDTNLIRQPPAARRPRALEIPPPPIVDAAAADSALDALHAASKAATATKRTRRIEGWYVLSGMTRANGGVLSITEAFKPKRELRWPPLVKVELASEIADEVAKVLVQYEPRTSGGSRIDVDRIVARAAKALGAQWRRA